MKKVKTYYSLAKIPTFSIDYGLYIDKFPKYKQPGLFVRRIYKDNREVTDEELLNYFVFELKKVGGESYASWISTIALAVSLNKIYTKTFKERKLFVSQRSKVLLEGEPLSSIQTHPITGRYESEMSLEEREKAKGEIADGFYKFMKEKVTYF